MTAAAVPICSAAVRAEVLERLREQIAARSLPAANVPVVKTGWPPIDDLLPEGGLRCGAVHEWLGTLDPAGAGPPGARRNVGCDGRTAWKPPLGLLAHLANQARATLNTARIIWIGQAVWPYPVALSTESGVDAGAGEQLLAHSIFVRAAHPAACAWAANLALSSRLATVVIVDGSELDLTATRRLQLAAESGAALGLLARPPWERDGLSAARTRWLVRSAPSPGPRQRWTVELLRCKGVQPTCSEAPRLWTLERDFHATRNVSLAADLVDGPDPARHPACEPRAG